MLLVLFVVSCTRNSSHPAETRNLVQEDAAAKVTAHYVGQKFGGGKVFYATLNGKHGLIADTLDLPAAVWYNGTFALMGTTSTAGGSGKANTQKIVAALGTPINAGYNYAAWVCSKSTRNGYTDWFLPSRDELKELYNQRAVVGNFTFNGYWSSSETDESFSWFVGFNDGHQGSSNKRNEFSVRAVRIF